MNNNPIGILDSGIGGLTIWKEIVQKLPQESTVYIGDSKNCPYGVRSPEQIYELSKRLVEFLIQRNCKLIVVACNTITVSCLTRLRAEFRGIPIVGTVPVVKTASEKSRSKRIGIFSTPITTNSQYQRDLINTFARECDVEAFGSDELVPFIEAGKLKSIEVSRVLEKELQHFKDAEIDVLALGCSHFPLVKNQIQKIMGKGVLVLDSGAAIARQVSRVLEKEGLQSTDYGLQHEFYTTGNKAQLSTILASMGYNKRVESIEL